MNDTEKYIVKQSGEIAELKNEIGSLVNTLNLARDRLAGFQVEQGYESIYCLRRLKYAIAHAQKFLP